MSWEDGSGSEGMARGVMLCATTQNGGSPPGVPGRLRKYYPPPPEFHRPHKMKEEPKFHGRVREVGPYRLDELQATLESKGEKIDRLQASNDELHAKLDRLLSAK